MPLEYTSLDLLRHNQATYQHTQHDHDKGFNQTG